MILAEQTAAPSDVAVVPFDSAKHWAWVRKPVRQLAGRRYQRQRTAKSLESQLRKEIALGRCALAVDSIDPDTFIGCAVVRRDAVVWCFTRPGCRRQKVARRLLCALGHLLTQPTGVVLWTPVAETLSRRLPIYPL